jgi:hypothetical protein
MSLDTIPTLTVTEANVLRRALPIVDEAQEMICPRCQHAFPAEFYCIVCGYVPSTRASD